MTRWDYTLDEIAAVIEGVNQRHDGQYEMLLWQAWYIGHFFREAYISARSRSHSYPTWTDVQRQYRTALAASRKKATSGTKAETDGVPAWMALKDRIGRMATDPAAPTKPKRRTKKGRG